MRDYAPWLIFGDRGYWSAWAYLSAWYQPCRTLIRGIPWEDTQ
jgi:hypothetical protein